MAGTGEEARGYRVVMSAHELLIEMATVVPHGHARRLLSRARRLAGVERADARESLETIELLMILEALAAEGGPLQSMAETLARRALYDDAHRHGLLEE
ncbi:MAG: hypothetical protein AB7F65_08030 [Dehalococcoidia bacterium]